ncbi:hypothetical protein IHN32_17150 [Deinococcus sp. 14RED07]|uniref:hypothetical protein n=1 Tax=Deinococcus sp. 14RED07 TaxID=2745874 RepID=UPI001E2D4B93|nr:hypothetical protein [Deinococcus sp. 14RED07]MCD0177666.1 hypothetical protein [Deinococcus sp. 14RED07]
MSANLRPGSRIARVYAVIAEFPGVPVSADEIATETGLDSHTVGNHAFNLKRRGLIEHSQPGSGRKAHYWINPQEP